MCDSYVIRLYKKKDPKGVQADEKMIGVIESSRNHRRMAFHDKDELWNALMNGIKREKQNFT